MSAGDIFNEIFSGYNIAAFGAVFTALMACIGSAKGVGIVGEAASGVLAEDPSKFGNCLLLQALPGSQGIYGFVAAFFIFTKIRLFQGGVQLDIGQGAYLLACGLPIAFVGFFSAISQGKVAAAGVELIARRDGQVVKAITSSALVETYAILALLVSLLPIIMFNI
ncbi:MAG: V-type ATP synthase subunit K [Clostridia bacterium]|nr:V-type ATP synthase subunit K [Clostridia bacterium]